MSQRLALRRARAALDIGEGLLVGRDQAGAGAAFDRHVADGHAAFHRQRADRLAGIFDDVAGAAGGADLADDGEDDVLGGDAGRQLAVDAHQHVLGLLLDQRLGGEHVLDLRRADAMRQRAEGAVRRGVASRRRRSSCPGSVKPCSGPMMWTMPWRWSNSDRNIRCRNRAAFCGQRLDLDARFPGPGFELASGRWSGRCGRPRRASARARGPCARSCAGPSKACGDGHLVDEVAVDVNEQTCRPGCSRPDGHPRFCRRACGPFGAKSRFAGVLWSWGHKPPTAGSSAAAVGGYPALPR